MSATPASAQSYEGAACADLQGLAAKHPETFGCPISGDHTAIAKARQQLMRIIAATHLARDEAGRAQREKANHTP